MKLALALTLAAIPSADGISAFAGGRANSPDGKWAVWVAEGDAEDRTAIARLRGPGVRDRGLMQFERSVDVIWPAGTAKVMLVERTIHFASIHVFALAPREIGARDRIQSDVERMMAWWGRLGTVTNRLIALGRLNVANCVLVVESGLPPGLSEGSFVTRRGAFRLDFHSGRAMPIRYCPGAKIG